LGITAAYTRLLLLYINIERFIINTVDDMNLKIILVVFIKLFYALT